MISDNEITPIGRFVKTHGVNGEINALVDPDIDIDSLRCVVVKIDGINVPFFIASSRAKGSESVLLTIDRIKDTDHAAELCGHDIYALRSDLDDDAEDGDDGFYVSDLIGYTLLDGDAATVGTVTGYDDSTANVLLKVTTADGREIYAPIAAELINDIDPDRQVISINLPEGLLDL